MAALYADFEQMFGSEPLQKAVRDTGAVVMGRRASPMADDPDSYAGTYGSRPMHLERTRVVELPGGCTHLRYRNTR